MLNCWPVACDDNLAMGLGFVIHVSKIGCVNVPGRDSHYPYAFHVFIPHRCQQFHDVSSMDTPTYYAIGPLHSASPVQPRGFAHQQVHHFRLALLSREIQGCFAWEPLLTFELTLSNII